MQTVTSSSWNAIRRRFGSLRSCVGFTAKELGLMSAVRAVRLRYYDWVVSRRDPEERWRGGINEEIKYWQRYLETKGFQWPDEYEARVNPTGQLLSEFVARHLPPDRQHIRILD